MKILALTLISTLAIAGSSWSQEADNTEKNKRDQSGETLTPIDQSNDPADLKMTAEIRKMLIADDSLSALAKNVKVITVEGVVTLRGPVETEKEKVTVAAHAKHVNPKKVVNQIEIKKS